MTSADSRETPSLRRELGPFSMVVYGVGGMLGAGIYALVGEIAGAAGTSAWLAFLIALLVAAPTAISYAELGSRLPEAGGEAAFCREGFATPAAGFLVGVLVFASGAASMATLAIAFARNLTPLIAIPESAGALVFLLAIGGIAYRGIRLTARANLVCTAIEIAGLAIVLVAGLAFLGQPVAAPSPAQAPGAPAGAIAIMSAGAVAFYAFIGFEDMVNVAEEVKAPRRTLPLAILVALGIVGVLYLAVAAVATSVVAPAELAAAKSPLLAVVDRAAPVVPSDLFTVIILFAIANTALLNFVTASRLLYGMARRGLMPAWLAAVHPRRQTPHRSILTVLVVIAALTLTGSLLGLAATTSLLLLLVFVAVNVALLRLRLAKTVAPSSFQSPILIPVLAIAACCALMPFVAVEAIVTVAVVLLLASALLVLRRNAIKRERRSAPIHSPERRG